MSLDQTSVALPAHALTHPTDRLADHPSSRSGLDEGLLDGVLDGERWWHETWASPAPAHRGPRAAQLPAWVQRVRAVVWPSACSRAL